MAAAFGWGLLAASSLVIGAVAARSCSGSAPRVIGLIMGFGAGVLISAVAFDLVEEAFDKATGNGSRDRRPARRVRRVLRRRLLIDRFGGGDRKDAGGAQASGSPLAIVLGTVLDGIPESMVIGLTIREGGAVGAAYLAAVLHLEPPRGDLVDRGPRRAAAGRRRASSGSGRRSRSSRASRRSPASGSSRTRRRTWSRSCSRSRPARS